MDTGLAFVRRSARTVVDERLDVELVERSITGSGEVDGLAEGGL